MARQDRRARRRFPQSVYGVGEEPDPRFSLANERTFLAWIRTALALLAAGVAVEALALPLQEGVRQVAALLFVTLGMLSGVQAWGGWKSAERAMRQARPLPAPALSGVVAGGVVVAAALLVVGLLA